MLTTGEYRVFPPNTRLAVRNAGPAPAVLVDVFALSLDYRAPASPEGVTTALGESVEVQVLVGGIATQMPKGPVVLAIGRATLAPGGRLAWDGAAGPAVIIVEAGTPAMHTTGGLAQARVTADGPLLSRTEDALVPGGNVLLEAGTSARVDAGPAGPATVLVFTLLPGTEPPPADAGPRTKSS